MKSLRPILFLLLLVAAPRIASALTIVYPVEAIAAVVSRVKHVHIRDCKGRQQSPGAPELHQLITNWQPHASSQHSPVV